MVFIEFVVKIASKQDQTLHMEGKLHVILYFRAVCDPSSMVWENLMSNFFFESDTSYLLR